MLRRVRAATVSVRRAAPAAVAVSARTADAPATATVPTTAGAAAGNAKALAVKSAFLEQAPCRCGGVDA